MKIKMIKQLGIVSCLTLACAVVSPSVVRAQSNAGFIIFGSAKDNALDYCLDSGNSGRSDRYYLEIKPQKFKVSEVIVTYPDHFNGSFDTSDMKLRVTDQCRGGKDLEIESATWDVTAAKRLRYPSMNLMAGTGYKNGYVPTLGSITFNFYIGVGLTIPIMPASRPTLQKRIAEISLSSYQLDLNTQTMTLTTAILNTLQDVRKNEKKLATCDDLVDQAHSALVLANQRYKEGVNINLDLLAAQTNYQNALLSKLQFEYNLVISKMEVCQLAGLRWW